MKLFLLSAIVLLVALNSASTAGVTKKSMLWDIRRKIRKVKCDVMTAKKNMTLLPEIKECVTNITDELQKLHDFCRITLQEGLSNQPPAEDGSSCDSPFRRMIKLQNNFYMMFRITPGIKRSAYERFLQRGVNDDENDFIFDRVPCGCKTTDGSQFCDRHYRSVFLDQLDRLFISTIRVSLYRKNREVKFFDFKTDNIQQDVTEFFKQGLIRMDPYTDISATSNPAEVFSIEGETGPDKDRRFFISNNTGNCDSDSGWLAVIDSEKSSSCSWEDFHGVMDYPYILYSTGRTKANFNNPGELGFADVLVVSVMAANPNIGCR